MNKEITINHYGNPYKKKLLVGVQQEKKQLNHNYLMEIFMYIIQKIKMENIPNQDLRLEWMEKIKLAK